MAVAWGELPLPSVPDAAVLFSRAVVLAAERGWKHRSVRRTCLAEHLGIASQHNCAVHEGEECSFQSAVLHSQKFWLFSKLNHRRGFLHFSQ